MNNSQVQATIKKAKTEGRRIRFADTDCRGLVLDVLSTGEFKWRFRYKRSGVSKTVALAARTLAEARREAEPLREIHRSGEDPQVVQERTNYTVRQLVDEFLAFGRQRGKRRIGGEMELSAEDFAAKFGTHRANKVDRYQIMAWIDSVAKGAASRSGKPAPHRARSYQKAAHAIYRFAISRGLVERNPLDSVEPVAVAVKRERVLTDDEIRRLWRGEGLPANVYDVLRLQLLTGCRIEEVCSLTTEQLRLSDPANTRFELMNTKNGQGRTVVLSRMAAKVLEEHGIPERGFVFRGTRGRQLAKEHVAHVVKALQPGATDPYRSHDIRRTVATRMSAAGESLDVIDMVLGHKLQGVRKTYVRDERLTQQRKALEDWSAYLTELWRRGYEKEMAELREGLPEFGQLLSNASQAYAKANPDREMC